MNDLCVLCSKQEPADKSIEMLICSNCVQRLVVLDNAGLQKLVDGLRLKENEDVADWIENRFFNEEEGIENGTVGNDRKLYRRGNTARTFRSDKRRSFGTPNKKGLTLHTVE